MNTNLEKLNDFNLFECVHGGGCYRAEIRQCIWNDYPYFLCIWYVDERGGRHPEFSNGYKTQARALDKLKHYWKGETVEWRRL